MALVISRFVALAALALPPAGFAQKAPQGVESPQPFQEAGVCARCHVISVVEWSMSAHRKVSTTCTSCHGPSLGHVKDERNNVKPDRLPRGAAVAALCSECHQQGCPKTGEVNGCQQCHHAHALVDPQKPAVAASPGTPPAEDARQRRFAALMADGEKYVKAEQWDQARTAFQAALAQRPDDARAAERLNLCQRRLAPSLAGFEFADPRFDPDTGLARNVHVTGVGIAMVLVPGGEFEMGSEQFPASKPVHVVRVRPFYLGQFEVTQGEWKSVMGSNPSAHQGGKFPDADRMPVEQVSWDDAQAFLRKLNEKIPGGGFRLPSEAEWEYAARTGGSKPEASAAGQNSPGPVDQGPAGSLGLYGMLGNVWEWCSSLSRPYPYNAADGRESPSEAGLRILRGGGFLDPPDLLDPAFRHAERPGRRLRSNGFRLARQVPNL